MIRVFIVFSVLFLSKKSIAQEACLFHSLGEEVTPLGKTLNYKKNSDSTYQVFWGEKGRTRKLPYSFSCETPPIARPSFYFENEDFIFLSRSCGTACRTGILLPLDFNKEVIFINSWLEADLKSGLIVSLDFEETLLIQVFNLNSHTKSDFKTDIECPFPILVSCVDKVEINNMEITVHWDKELNQHPSIFNVSK